MFRPVNVFLNCRRCGHPNRIDGIPANRTALALFRGSEDPVKCKSCGAGMDTMLAYLGELVGSEIVRRDDPKY